MALIKCVHCFVQFQESIARAIASRNTTSRPERILPDGPPELLAASLFNYAKFYSRSHNAVIRVYDEAGNVIETHGQTGEFR